MSHNDNSKCHDRKFNTHCCDTCSTCYLMWCDKEQQVVVMFVITYSKHIMQILSHSTLLSATFTILHNTVKNTVVVMNSILSGVTVKQFVSMMLIDDCRVLTHTHTHTPAMIIVLLMLLLLLLFLFLLLFWLRLWYTRSNLTVCVCVNHNH